MIKQGNARRCAARGIHLAVSGFLLAGGLTLALAGAGDGGYRLPPNLLEYFRARYGITEDGITSTLRETPDGPHGSLTLHGTMRLPANAEGGTPADRARSAARAFLEREADLLNIADLSELKESELKFDRREVCAIVYRWFIGGLPLAEAYMDFRIEPDGTIREFHATLVPVPAGLRPALQRDRLSQDDVKAIVIRDLARPDAQETPVVRDPVLSLTWKPPYLRWDASGALRQGKLPWLYWIDPFTGEILRKECTPVPTIVAVPPGGPTLCD